ncbi:thioesterase domain-containing protein [Nonomuraea gerenzanensis]|uniref:Non-ribosomal peptide synthetase n=1 Tax=Nonomuraea gerenzanensis TaxID=93944 RepID=A0A1M4EAB4_9ACTN|nr:thioesterase domain-containing protein [Nonomuraea gerenzanensis]UBU18011.1 alpha/beta fold hydrolase [Nonomuraea gerenzanensis]SBO95815.1 non-ribosomal peptide synthetase [Nonomuraea gerenzanensis]
MDTDVLLPLRTTGSGVPLFCVHPLLGLGWCYTGLVPYLGRRPVYCLQARRRPVGDLAAMVADYLTQVRAVCPDGPYQLMGWSAGGSIAHAMACELQRRGARVGFLALLDSFPSTGEYVRPADPEGDRLDLARTLAQDLGTRRGPDPGDDTTLVLRRLAGDSGLSERFLTELVDTALRTRAAVRGSLPGVFRGDVLHLEAARESRGTLTPRAWERHLDGRLEVRRVDCRHVDMMRPGPLSVIGPILAAGLDTPAHR